MEAVYSLFAAAAQGGMAVLFGLFILALVGGLWVVISTLVAAVAKGGLVGDQAEGQDVDWTGGYRP